MIKKASTYFTETDKKIIAEAVKETESKTSSEIVPVAATVSGRYDRAEDIFGFLFALVLLVLAGMLPADWIPGDWQWATGDVPSHALSLFCTIIILVVGFVLGSVMATFFPILRLPFIPKSEMTEEVERRAAEAFQKFRVRKTKGATGVLIYVSLYERMVRVLGDDSVTEKLEQNAWEGICSLVVQGMRDGKPGEGYQQAILKCAEVLQPHFPVQPGDVDELSNELQIID